MYNGTTSRYMDPSLEKNEWPQRRDLQILTFGRRQAKWLGLPITLKFRLSKVKPISGYATPWHTEVSICILVPHF